MRRRLRSRRLLGRGDEGRDHKGSGITGDGNRGHKGSEVTVKEMWGRKTWILNEELKVKTLDSSKFLTLWLRRIEVHGWDGSVKGGLLDAVTAKVIFWGQIPIADDNARWFPRISFSKSRSSSRHTAQRKVLLFSFRYLATNAALISISFVSAKMHLIKSWSYWNFHECGKQM